MNHEQTHEIAFMRYSVIAPLISGLQDSFPSHEAFFRDASARGIVAPDGSTKHFAPIPSSRADLGKPRKLTMSFRNRSDI